MAALDTVDTGVLAALKTEVNKLVWKLFDDIKDDSIPIHISVFHIPVSINVKIENLQAIIEKLVGPEVIDPTDSTTSSTQTASQ